jgi:hypothetical protein
VHELTSDKYLETIDTTIVINFLVQIIDTGLKSQDLLDLNIVIRASLCQSKITY